MPTRKRTALVAATAAVAALVVLAITVWRCLDLGPVHRAVVSSVPARGSGFWQIVIDDRDEYVFAHGAVTDRGRIAFAPFGARLASIGELRLLPNAGPGGHAGFAFWIEGRRRTRAPFIAANGADHPALRRFASDLHDAVVADVRRRDAPLIGALTSLRALRRVEATSNGCFGPCGVYELAFAADGGGTFASRADRVIHRAHGADWSSVLSELRHAHVERLERKYAVAAIDTQSAALRFVFPALDYRVDAPDSSSWPPEFHAAFRALRHRAARTAWSPPLSADELRTLAR